MPAVYASAIKGGLLIWFTPTEMWSAETGTSPGDDACPVKVRNTFAALHEKSTSLNLTNLGMNLRRPPPPGFARQKLSEVTQTADVLSFEVR